MLSIIYITCNRSTELKKSVYSCEKRVSMKHEYVIVDNGSKDDTADMVEGLKREGLPVRYLLQDSNKGVSGGRNIGFKEAQGDICYFIDDDATIVSEGFVLDSAYEYMSNRPEVFAMGTDAYDTERKCKLVGTPEKGKSVDSNCRIRNYVGCSHFIKKTSHFYGEYLYPNNLMYGSEEMYAGMSIYAAGGIVEQYPQLKVLHEPSKSTRDSRRIRQRNGHINTYVIKKYFLPQPYKMVSDILFFLRITRFEKGNLKRIVEDYRIVNERFDIQYQKMMSHTRVRKMIQMFKIKQVV